MSEHTLEFLLGFNGLRHWYQGGYYLKFEVVRVQPSQLKPHGLSYSLTFHAPNGKRLMGFDNAHVVRSWGSRFKKKPVEADHWHRTEKDPGRPYVFKDADTLLEDFFREVYRLLEKHGIPEDVIRVDEV